VVDNSPMHRVVNSLMGEVGRRARGIKRPDRAGETPNWFPCMYREVTLTPGLFF